jgi:alpha-beta hydrolase superfamily lysophospholipase
MKKILTLLLLIVFVSFATEAQNLKRKGLLGIALAPVTDSTALRLKLKDTRGILVMNTIPNTTATALGLQSDDVILSINGKSVGQVPEVVAMAGKLREGEDIKVEIIRAGKPKILSGKVIGRPTEKDATADVIYDEVAFGGGYMRAIIKKPKGIDHPPVIYFLQGYPCSTVDFIEQNVIKMLIDDMVKGGFCVFRMEKPGVGDSNNSRDCASMGYNEELAAFDAGYQKLLSLGYVDTSNIFLFGHSLGGLTAPLLAQKYQPKGVAVYGTVLKPWAEYLLDVSRKQATLVGTDYREIAQYMRIMHPVIYKYLVEKKTPAELATDTAYARAMVDFWDYNNKGEILQRHYTFWQEVQDLELVAAWAKTKSYVLAMHGETDIAAVDNEAAEDITAIVNAAHPGKATYKLVPETDHLLVKTGSIKQYVAVSKMPGYKQIELQNFNHQAVSEITAWMKDKIGKKL